VLLARVDAPSSGRCLNPVPPLNPCLIRQVSTQLRGPTQRSAEVTGTVRGRSQSQVLQAQIAFDQQTLWVDGLIIRSGPVVDPVRAAREALGRDQLASPERPAHGRRCRCGWPPAARRSRPPATPNANCTRWSSPHPRSCRNGSGAARPASSWPPAPGWGVQASWDVETATTAATLPSLARRIRD
jgi:hypothetical protein